MQVRDQSKSIYDIQGRGYLILISYLVFIPTYKGEKTFPGTPGSTFQILGYVSDDNTNRKIRKKERNSLLEFMLSLAFSVAFSAF